MKIFRKHFIVLLVLILGLVFLNFFPNITKASGNFIFKIFSPVQKLFISLGNKITGSFQILFSISDLAKENEQLKQKNSNLELQLTELNELRKENENLRNALDFPLKNSLVYAMSSIVGKNLQGTDDWILINKGTKDGLDKNMAVVSGDFYLVGKIVDAGKDFSKVTLITDRNSMVSAMVENNRNEGLVQKDASAGKIFLDFVPKNETIELGEKIITSGMDNIYPKGIIIGTVQNIDSSENQLFLKIIISPGADFEKLENVFILKSK